VLLPTRARLPSSLRQTTVPPLTPTDAMATTDDDDDDDDDVTSNKNQRRECDAWPLVVAFIVLREPWPNCMSSSTSSTSSLRRVAACQVLGYTNKSLNGCAMRFSCNGSGWYNHRAIAGLHFPRFPTVLIWAWSPNTAGAQANQFIMHCAGLRRAKLTNAPSLYTPNTDLACGSIKLAPLRCIAETHSLTAIRSSSTTTTTTTTTSSNTQVALAQRYQLQEQSTLSANGIDPAERRGVAH
jgi:hypothetical protein